jgi:hypothetical protein
MNRVSPASIVDPGRVPVHVEVSIKASCSLSAARVAQQVHSYLSINHDTVFEVGIISVPKSDPVASMVDWIGVTDLCEECVPSWCATYFIASVMST